MKMVRHSLETSKTFIYDISLFNKTIKRYVIHRCSNCKKWCKASWKPAKQPVCLGELHLMSECCNFKVKTEHYVCQQSNTI